MIKLLIGGIQRGEAPPARKRHGIGEDAVGVGLHDLRHHILVGRFVLLILVVQLDFHIGAGHGLAVQQHLPLKHIASIIAEGTGQGNDFRLEPGGLIPAFLFAERRHISLGVMDDVAILGGLPVRLRLHDELIDAGPLDRILRGPAVVIHDFFGFEAGFQVFSLAIGNDLHRFRLGQRHTLHFHRMGKGQVQRDVGVLLVRHRARRRDDHAEVRKRNAGNGQHHDATHQKRFPHNRISLCRADGSQKGTPHAVKP